jgi:hypothetical protein
LVVVDQAQVLTSTLSLVMDGGASLSANSLQKLEGSQGLRMVIPNVTQPPGGGSWYPLHCYQSYTGTDSDGTLTLQNNCLVSIVPWGYKLSAYLQSVAISYVAESGMSWQRNFVVMPLNAPHLEPSSYTFHGTFNPVHNYDYITCADTLTFRVNIGGATGTATVGVTCAFESVP